MISDVSRLSSMSDQSSGADAAAKPGAGGGTANILKQKLRRMMSNPALNIEEKIEDADYSAESTRLTERGGGQNKNDLTL